MGKISSIIILLFIISGTMILFEGTNAKNSNINDNWSYRKPIYIENNVNNYQSRIIVSKYPNSSADIDCNGHCNNDFSDIRFTNPDGNLIPYWIEEFSYANHSIIWVKNEYNNVKLYMYYGNKKVNSTSSITDTWIWSEIWNINHTKEYTHISGNDGKGEIYLKQVNLVPPFRFISNIRFLEWKSGKYGSNTEMGFIKTQNAVKDASDGWSIRHSCDTDSEAGESTLALLGLARKDGSANNSGWKTTPLSLDTWYKQIVCYNKDNLDFKLLTNDYKNMKCGGYVTSSIMEEPKYFGFGDRWASSQTEDYWKYNNTNDWIEWGCERQNGISKIKTASQWQLIGEYPSIEPSLNFGSEETDFNLDKSYNNNEEQDKNSEDSTDENNNNETPGFIISILLIVVILFIILKRREK